MEETYLVNKLNYNLTTAKFHYDSFETLIKLLQLKLKVGLDQDTGINQIIDEIIFTINNIRIISSNVITDQFRIMTYLNPILIAYGDKYNLMSYYEKLFEGVEGCKGSILATMYEYLKVHEINLIESTFDTIQEEYFDKYYLDDCNDSKLESLYTLLDYETVFKYNNRETINNIIQKINNLQVKGEITKLMEEVEIR